MADAVTVSAEECATKLLDEMLVLFDLYKQPENFSIVERAMRQIAACRERNPFYPITPSLEQHMREIGLLACDLPPQLRPTLP